MKKHIYIIIAILTLICHSIKSQTLDGNFVMIITPKTETKSVVYDKSNNKLIIDKSLDPAASVLVDIQYYDDLGRPNQTVQVGVSPKGKDLVSLQTYDAFGREAESWLPGISSGNGAYADPVQIKNSVISLNSNDQKPFSKPIYESSPLNRVVKQYGPGQDWQNNGKSVGFEYLTNTTSGELSCVYFSVTGSGVNTTLEKNSNYAAGQLYVTKTTDEDGNISYEFKDKQGQIVLTRLLNNNPNGNFIHDTYYVYDDYGNLCYVLPPMAVSKATNFSDDNEVIKQYAYLYKYDLRNRCIKKRIPGTEWISFVYDKADRLIFSQDGEQYTKGDWAFSIPDAFGRNVLTGICKKVKIGNNSESSITIGCLDQTFVKAVWASTTNPLKGYTISGASPVTPTVYSANYYDGYTFLGKNSIPDDDDTHYNAESGYGAQYTQSAKGLLTGSLTAQQLSNGAISSTYLYSVMYYDIRGQVVQTKSNNHLSGGIDKGYMAYNFAGQPILQKTIHSATGKATQTEVYGYSYDHAGRLLETKHKMNSIAEILLAKNEYDELGRLKNNTKNNQPNLTTEYAYNVRSWIKSISSPLFKQSLVYNEINEIEQKHYYLEPSYNGNVIAAKWQSASGIYKEYQFFYDNLSQLTGAFYQDEKILNGQDSPLCDVYYEYDLNGNATMIDRWGLVDDYLTMEYKGNQLIKADDYSNYNQPLATSGDFRDYSRTAVEYAYNKNGAMTKDLNKGISDIQYNSLNLPRLMDIKSPVAEARNEYTYSVGGKKLKVVQKWNPNFSAAPIIGSGINVGSLSLT